MLWSAAEIHIALDTVKARFPDVTDERYHNEIDGDFLGFTLWGTFTLDPDDLTAKRFFITFTQGPDSGQGDLTVRQPAYLWTRADAGDAYLLDTAAVRHLGGGHRRPEEGDAPVGPSGGR